MILQENTVAVGNNVNESMPLVTKDVCKKVFVKYYVENE